MTDLGGAVLLFRSRSAQQRHEIRHTRVQGGVLPITCSK